MTSNQSQIDALHRLYCQLTGQSISMRFDRTKLWFDFYRHQFGPNDLKLVLRYLKCQIALGKRNPGALKLRNLLQPDTFEEDLHLAKIHYRIGQTSVAIPPSPNPCSNQTGSRITNQLRHWRKTYLSSKST